MATTLPILGSAADDIEMHNKHAFTSNESPLGELTRNPQNAPSYRCRLYCTVPEAFPGEDLYVEVWDSRTQQEDVSKLPSGSRLVGTFEDPSKVEATRQLDEFCEERNLRLVGSWNSRGSL